MTAHPLPPHASVPVDELHLAKMRLELAESRYQQFMTRSHFTDAQERDLDVAEDNRAAAREEFRRLLGARAGMDADAIEEALGI